MAPPRPPPELVDDTIAEILLRLSPDEPADLTRASLVCKWWCRILSSAAFLRRYRRFHHSPPLLGFFENPGTYFLYPTPLFIPTTMAASPFRQTVFDCRSYFPQDCRHDRLLLKKLETDHLVVWDLITSGWESVPEPHTNVMWFAAAVLCAVTGCDHRDCHGGPYLVIRMGTASDNMVAIVHACVYSSQVGSWGTSVSVPVGSGYVTQGRGTLVGDEMHFVLAPRDKFLRYNFIKNCLSLINPPERYEKGIVLMLTEDGLLGLAGVRGCNLHLWSRKANAEGVEQWVKCRVIELHKLLPVANPFKQTIVTGFAEGVGVIFVGTDIGAFIIELKTMQARKVAEPRFYRPVIPVMSFCTPACACSKLPLPVD